MGALWKKIINLGVDENTNDWNQRNLRLMNSMTFIICCSLIFFGIMEFPMGGEKLLPSLIVSFLVSALYFPIAMRAPLKITKVYFCLLPVGIISLYAIFGVGNAGNDIHYLFVTAILPIVIFRERKLYVPLIAVSIIAYFVALYAQTIFDPVVILDEKVVVSYRLVNISMVFVFLLALMALFKFEISGYETEIEEQKQRVEEKNMEITESITYAKRIQEAILPPAEKFRKYLPESFVLYLPKDIVAGDFYWLETADIDSAQSVVLFAAADCTGHGVPGAMVSVICNNALNRSVREYGLSDPGRILDKTREIVISEFEKSEEEVKDGMDISLCSLRLRSDCNSAMLSWAGANNPLWIIRKGVGEVEEVRADKQPIGKYTDPKPFTTHTIELQKGDTIYVFTDGFQDQFGGNKGKKFKATNFKKYLLTIQDQSIEKHTQLIDKVFENWRGPIEQIDDVCVIGVRI